MVRLAILLHGLPHTENSAGVSTRRNTLCAGTLRPSERPKPLRSLNAPLPPILSLRPSGCSHSAQRLAVVLLRPERS